MLEIKRISSILRWVFSSWRGSFSSLPICPI